MYRKKVNKVSILKASIINGFIICCITHLRLECNLDKHEYKSYKVKAKPVNWKTKVG